MKSIQKESTPVVRIQVKAARRLWHLQADRVQLLIEQRPGFTKALLDEATNGLRHSFQVLAASTFTTVRARVARGDRRAGQRAGSSVRGHPPDGDSSVARGRDRFGPGSGGTRAP